MREDIDTISVDIETSLFFSYYMFVATTFIKKIVWIKSGLKVLEHIYIYVS